jgi:PilZ domain
MERRGWRRFNLQAPVQFTWRLPGSGVASEDGRTRDISVRGVFVLASTCPPEGSVLRMRVSLPGWPGDSSLEMQADATVVRVEDSGSEDCPGFAAITKRCLYRAGGSERKVRSGVRKWQGPIQKEPAAPAVCVMNAKVSGKCSALVGSR